MIFPFPVPDDYTTYCTGRAAAQQPCDQAHKLQTQRGSHYRELRDLQVDIAVPLVSLNSGPSSGSVLHALGPLLVNRHHDIGPRSGMSRNRAPPAARGQ